MKHLRFRSVPRSPRSAPSPRASRPLRVALALSLSFSLPLLASAAAFTGCAQESTEVSVRSLEQSGPVAFVCLAAHSAPAPGLPLSACSRTPKSTPYDFGETDGVTKSPHLYALVTQTTRGEVAVVDTTSIIDSVIDEDPSVPGANFLQIGAQPVDIVSTPGGTATFVAVAEVGRAGIYALPSTRIRPCLTTPSATATAEEKAKCGPPTISSWPACSLPSAPGSMIMVPDAAVDKAVRVTCDDKVYVEEPAVGENGDIGAEGNGRQKLVVAMPELGGIAVFDAQAILDLKAGGGTESKFEECKVERWVPLEVAAHPPQDPKPIDQGPACVIPKQPELDAVPGGASRPAGLSYAAGRLYVADLDAPVIHVLDMATPCDPIARPPLLPTSRQDPKRIVTTSRVAVTPELTAGLRRYVYAIDADEGSTMVFDVSDSGGSRYPLLRPHPEWNPFEPVDRIRFVSPARDLVIVQRDVPAGSPVTGVAPEGTRCDPDPRATCDGTSVTCDLGALYRTASDFGSGAAPGKLRGTFAFLMLTAGQVVIIDIDDLDGMCRIPKELDVTYGCPPASFLRECSADADCAGGRRCGALGRCVDASCFQALPNGGEKVTCGGTGCDPCAWAGSGEASCNVVVPHTPRSSAHVVTNDAVGRHEPGVQGFPLLIDKSGTLIPATDEAAPRLHAPKPASAITRSLVVAGAREPIDGTGQVTSDEGPRSTLAMSLEDPRSHIVDQPWVITFEGGLVGFSEKLGSVRLLNKDDPSQGYMLFDPNSRFCDRGVQSQESVRSILLAEGEPAATLDAAVAALTDVAQIATDLPAQDDVHWKNVASESESWATLTKEQCTYQVCKATFGTADAPRLERDFPIREAYQDRLELADVDLAIGVGGGDGAVVDGGELARCCFPSTVAFNVRARGQWVVTGQGSGFLHHVIADPASGVCRNSCDPDVQRLNGRIRTAPRDAFTSMDPVVTASVTDGGKFAFLNPIFRFVVTEGAQKTQRDTQFSFFTQGSFAPLLVNLAGVSSTVQPRAIRHVPPTNELAISDGSLEGLLMLNISNIEVSRQYY